jgi:tRNA-splicing ligase RtcB (3'-phosphate/5'-hydroxy nucleic acid ligase)
VNEPIVFGQADDKTMAQARTVARSAEHVALMADNHLGYVMPIGGVAAYRNKVSVVGVGFDIACGNAAIETDIPLGRFSRAELVEVADAIHREISFGVGRKNEANDAPEDHPLFDDPAWDAVPTDGQGSRGGASRNNLRLKARQQLGTVGSGNHYVDVFAGEKSLWVGVHFGSRGFGHTVASGFLALGQNEPWGARVPEKEILFDLDQPLGQDYFALMNLAGRYAYAGREWVARKVVSILGGQELRLVHNHHNFAWRERHWDQDWIVVRKGATPAFPGQYGFVGGSMGDCSVILKGAELGPAQRLQEQALFSTVHGAGRVMSRTEAAGRVKKERGWKCRNRDCGGTLPMEAAPTQGQAPVCPRCAGAMQGSLVDREVRPGRISAGMMSEWLEREGVILRGGGLDEAPQAYRRLPDVLAAQGSTIEVVEVLRPLIVAMAGADVADPWRD